MNRTISTVLNKIIFGGAVLILLISCKKSGSSATDPVIPVSGCDYVMDETQLTANGWTKLFEDNFDSDLSKWTIWNGGAYNNELQLYQAANLSLVNGSLEIRAKKRNSNRTYFA